MEISQLLSSLSTKHSRQFNLALKKALPMNKIKQIETDLNIQLPDDLVEFYATSNGIEGDDFIFNIIPLNEVTKDVDSEGEYIEFAEYMIFSETCGLEINPLNKNSYRFFSGWVKDNIQTTTRRKYIANSITEFIQLYLQKGTFGIWTDD